MHRERIYRGRLLAGSEPWSNVDTLKLKERPAACSTAMPRKAFEKRHVNRPSELDILQIHASQLGW